MGLSAEDNTKGKAVAPQTLKIRITKEKVNEFMSELKSLFEMTVCPRSAAVRIFSVRQVLDVLMSTSSRKKKRRLCRLFLLVVYTKRWEQINRRKESVLFGIC